MGAETGNDPAVCQERLEKATDDRMQPLFVFHTFEAHAGLVCSYTISKPWLHDDGSMGGLHGQRGTLRIQPEERVGHFVLWGLFYLLPGRSSWILCETLSN